MAEFTEDEVHQLGDKDLKHFYEVALLEQYWGHERRAHIELYEEELQRRGLDREEIQRPLMERVPQLDAALEKLFAGFDPSKQSLRQAPSQPQSQGNYRGGNRNRRRGGR